MRIFIGSSREALEYALLVASWLEKIKHEPVVWDRLGLFPLGESTFPTLVRLSKEVDGAMFLFTDDDKVWYRGDSLAQPRDNVLIEFGLFAGTLGMGRCVICRRGASKIATDLHGITVCDISPSRQSAAEYEIRAWANGLSSGNLDPAMIQMIGKLKRSEDEKEHLRAKEQFARQTADDLRTLLTKAGVVDFKTYDLDSDGMWKLLYQRSFFMSVADLLARVLGTGGALKAELESTGLVDIAGRVDWQHDRDSDRTWVFAAKVLRLFRLYENPRRFKQFVDKARPEIADPLKQIARTAIDDLAFKKDHQVPD